MSAIGFEFMADNDHRNCERCLSSDWPRIGFIIDPTHKAVICIYCLAGAIEAVTGWKVKAMLERYRRVSPLFENPATDWGMRVQANKDYGAAGKPERSTPTARKEK